MIGHLGPRVSDLLDGRLSAVEEERAWAHVHGCRLCGDLVEREGWIKSRLLGLSDTAASPGLKGSLLGAPALAGFAGPSPLDGGQPSGGTGSRRPTLGIAVLGGGAAGAAVLGVIALGASPAQAPTIDRRPPVTSLLRPTDGGTGPTVAGFLPARSRSRTSGIGVPGASTGSP